MLLKKSKLGFTIIELSLVLIIVSSLFAVGIVSYQSTFIKSRKEISEEKLETIYNALKAYLKTNRKLPCPASLGLSAGDSSFGTAVGLDGSCSGTGVIISSANSNLAYGMVPVKTLGLASNIAGDGFNTKFSYVVDIRFTALVNAAATTGFEGSDPDDADMIEIREISASTTPAIMENAIIVIISHGANKLGGFNMGNTTQNPTTNITDDEEENIQLSDFDEIFVTDSTNSRFDDSLLFKNKIEIAKDAGFYDMICREADSTYITPIGSNYGTDKCYDDSGITISLTWEKANYGELAIPKNDDACPAGCMYNLNPTDYDSNVNTYHPLRRCGKYGVWSPVIYPCYKTTID